LGHSVDFVDVESGIDEYKTIWSNLDTPTDTISDSPNVVLV